MNVKVVAVDVCDKPLDLLNIPHLGSVRYMEHMDHSWDKALLLGRVLSRAGGI